MTLPRTIARAALGVVLATAGARAAERPVADEIAAIWRSPGFQKQFVGSYGINAEIEPRVSPEEVALLEKVRPLMATQPLKVAKMLELELAKPGASASLDMTVGNIYLQADQIDKAERHFRRAVAKFPSFRRAYRNLGLVHVRNGKNTDAIHSFTRMIELGGGDAYSLGLLGFAYAAEQDFLAAEGCFRESLMLQPDNLEWRLALVRSVLKQQKFEDAVSLLNVLVEQHPENPDFWLLQANALVGMKQNQRAIVNLECLDLLGKSTTDALNTLGDLYASESLPAMAADSYVRAIERDPSQPPARPLRNAEVLAARGALAEAGTVVAGIRKSLEGELPAAEKSKLLKLEARIVTAAGAESDQILRVLEETIALDPMDGEALLLLGQHYGRQGDMDRAILYYERAAAIEAHEANAKLLHGQALVRMGRLADAIVLLRRVQELKPREDVARYLEQVERLAKARK